MQGTWVGGLVNGEINPIPSPLAERRNTAKTSEVSLANHGRLPGGV